MKNPRLLIVDDESDMRWVIRGVFEDEDFEIAEAENGAEAVSVVQEFQPDVVLTDLMMPEMDGKELLKHCVQIDADLPVIRVHAQRPVLRLHQHLVVQVGHQRGHAALERHEVVDEPVLVELAADPDADPVVVAVQPLATSPAVGDEVAGGE